MKSPKVRLNSEFNSYMKLYINTQYYTLTWAPANFKETHLWRNIFLITLNEVKVKQVELNHSESKKKNIFLLE